MREIGGWKSIARNRNNTTVLAVLLEDAVALLGILLTLIVAGVSFLWGPHPAFDAAVAIAVGALLGVMAIFLAAINRRLLIDSSDPVLDRAADRFLAEKGLPAKVSSILVDDDRGVLFVRVAASRRARTSHRISCAGRGAQGACARARRKNGRRRLLAVSGLDEPIAQNDRGKPSTCSAT